MKKFILIAVLFTSIFNITGCTTGTNTDTVTNLETTVYNIKQPQDIFIDEFNRLLKGDNETVVRYFGESDIYTPEAVKERLSVVKIEFNSPEDIISQFMSEVSITGEGSITLDVDICTLNYQRELVAIDTLADRLLSEQPYLTSEQLEYKIDREIKARAKNGEFDEHIIIPVTIHYTDGEGQVQISEQLKVSLTGGWYNPHYDILEKGDTYGR